MGANKELFADMRVNVTMDADVYEWFKEFAGEENYDFNRYESPSLKEIYKKDPEWVEANKTLKEAIEYRSEIESRIRVDKQIELYGC